MGLLSWSARAHHCCSFISLAKAPEWIQTDESLPVLGVRALQSAAEATPTDLEDVRNTTGLIQCCVWYTTALGQDTLFNSLNLFYYPAEVQYWKH